MFGRVFADIVDARLECLRALPEGSEVAMVLRGWGHLHGDQFIDPSPRIFKRQTWSHGGVPLREQPGQPATGLVYNARSRESWDN